MFSNLWILRPDCEKVLNEKSFWALDLVHIDKELKLLSINEKSIDENFIQYFIRMKINRK